MLGVYKYVSVLSNKIIHAHSRARLLFRGCLFPCCPPFLKLSLRVVTAVSFLHSKKMVHRDIKSTSVRFRLWFYGSCFFNNVAKSKHGQYGFIMVYPLFLHDLWLIHLWLKLWWLNNNFYSVMVLQVNHPSWHQATKIEIHLPLKMGYTPLWLFTATNLWFIVTQRLRVTDTIPICCLLSLHFPGPRIMYSIFVSPKCRP